MFKLFPFGRSRQRSQGAAPEALRDDEMDKARGGIIAILIGLAKPKEPARPAEFHQPQGPAA